MMVTRNGGSPTSPPAHPEHDLEPLSSQQVWERLEAELADGLGLDESSPVVHASEVQVPPEPDDDLAREFRSIGEEMIGAISELKLHLMSMVQEEFYEVYREVLEVSKEMDLSFVSAANLIADGLSSDKNLVEGLGAKGPAAIDQIESASEALDMEISDHAAVETQETKPDPAQAQPNLLPVPPREQVLGTAMSPGAAEKELFEGTVRLSVKANGDVRQLLQFVGSLSRKPEIRLLRLLGDHRWVDLWVGLSRPIALYAELGKMDGVSKVANVWELDGEEKERRIELCLEAALPLAEEPAGEPPEDETPDE